MPVFQLRAFTHQPACVLLRNVHCFDVVAHLNATNIGNGLGIDKAEMIARHYFSRRTPLNFFAAFFFAAGFLTAMNFPPFLLRFVHAVAPSSMVLSWVRFLTALLRALSPVGSLTAISFSFARLCIRRALVPGSRKH